LKQFQELLSLQHVKPATMSFKIVDGGYVLFCKEDMLPVSTDELGKALNEQEIKSFFYKNRKLN